MLCIDITKIDKNYHLFCVLDLAARNIVGHCFVQDNLNVSTIVETLSQIIEDRSFLPKVQIIHSDRESFFKNNPYYDFLKKNHINISVASSKGHGNQVIERTFRTLKTLIKLELKMPIKSPTISLSSFNGFKEKAPFIKMIIERYNNKPHKSLYGLTPNLMEEALFVPNSVENIIDDDLVPLLAKNEDDGSETTTKLIQYKQKGIQNFAGS